MSRSYRKNLITWICTKSQKLEKKLFARRRRRVIKHLISKQEYNLPLDLELSDATYWCWSSDGKMYYGDIENEDTVNKVKRK